MINPSSGTLVTGASGFLGTRLCERLQKEGERVVALGRHPGPGPWDAFIEADIAAGSLPDGAFEGITTIYHLASKAHAVAENAADADTYLPVIVDGTRRMVEAARKAGIRRFIYISSVKAMGEGNPDGIPLAVMDESWPHTPQSPYGKAKALAESIVLEAGFPHAVVLRPVMIYGPGEKGNLPRMVHAVQRGRFPPLPDNGNRRSMIHMEDVVEYCLRAATYPIAAGNTYILAAPEALSTRQLYDLIRASLSLSRINWSVPMFLLKSAALTGSLLGKLLHKRMPLDCDTLRKLTGSAWYSAAKAQSELDYTACHTVQEWLRYGGR
jgi:nucleoside-diphosphate-sugar epimerase